MIKGMRFINLVIISVVFYAIGYNSVSSATAFQFNNAGKPMNWQVNEELIPSLYLSWVDENTLINFTPSTMCSYNLSTEEFGSHPIFTNDSAKFVEYYAETHQVIWVTSSRKEIRVGFLEDTRLEDVNLHYTLEFEASVTSLALSHDGLLFGTGHADGSISLWDSQTGELIFTEKPHTLAVSSIIFSPNDMQLVSAGRRDGNIFFWDIETLTQTQTIELKVNYVPYAIAQIQFDNQGNYLMAANETLAIPIWQVDNGDLVADVNLEASLSVAISPDNRWLVSTRRNSLYLWNMVEQDDTIVIGEPFIFDDIQSITQHAFNPTGNFLAIAYENGIGIVDITNQELIETLPKCSSE